ncbi:hypothetical protein [Maribacter sp.]|uniref:hypothetical protein n=1 Tax=Maribacter sp. TaxID=1897614 RepID=UPI003C77D8F3
MGKSGKEKNVVLAFLSLVVLLVLSCSKDENTITPEPEPEVPIFAAVDTYTYIALRNDGTLFEIGDEGGSIEQVKKINNITFNTIFNTVTSSTQKTFVYEQMPEIISNGTSTGFRGQLCALDNQSLQSGCTILDFSNHDFPEFAGLIALDWDEKNKNLVGIVTDVVNESPENINYVVRIDPTTFEIISTDVQFVKHGIISSLLVDNTYYISTMVDGSGHSELMTIDLITGETRDIDFSNVDSSPFLLSKNDEGTKYFGLAWEFNTGFFNAAVPVSFGADSSIVEIATTKRIFFKITVGKSFYNQANKEHVVLVDTEDGAGLLRYNSENGTLRIIGLKPLQNELSSFVAIVQVK